MSEIILGLLMFLLFMAFWITPVVLGIRAARKKLRSPHWMWFGVHPIGGWITFAVLASLPPLKECPQCAEKVKAHAKVCPYCMIPLSPEDQVQSDPIATNPETKGPPETNSISTLQTTLVVGRLIVVFICFLCVLLYTLVFITAVLKGNPRGFFVGFAQVPFKEPPVIILLSLSVITLIGTVGGQAWYFRPSRPKKRLTPAINVIVVIIASALLESIAIYGLVLGFMFGPGMASLSLILLATTMLGGTLVFPTTKTWLGRDSQPRIPSTRSTV